MTTNNNSTHAQPSILVLGAGRSSTALIRFLAHKQAEKGWQITVADASEALAAQKCAPFPALKTLTFDIGDHEASLNAIREADVVISLLPPALHLKVARHCLNAKKHLLTASYLNPEFKALHQEARLQQVTLLAECGLDPGIDHMSAMELIHRIKATGAKVTRFSSWCGGLPAKGFKGNPWGYQISWNPQNVVVAGQGTTTYLSEGRLKQLPYHRLFQEAWQLDIPNAGAFDGYPNRDSLAYRSVYGLEHLKTMLRGTLREAGYCKAWGALVFLGLTDNVSLQEKPHLLTYGQWLESFLPTMEGANENGHSNSLSLRQRTAQALNLPETDEVLDKIEWLGLFSYQQAIPNKEGTAANILQTLLEQKWALGPQDADRVVMFHQIGWEKDGEEGQVTSSMELHGENSSYTAMAAGVGLPLGLAAEAIIEGKISTRGVLVPTLPEIYESILPALSKYGINFTESGVLPEPVQLSAN